MTETKGRQTQNITECAASALRTAAITLVLVTASWLPGDAQEKVTVVLDWLPGGTKAVMYVAAQQGFFAKEGLEVKIDHARGTTDAITRIGSGQAEFATGGLPSLLEAIAETKVPAKAVMSFYSKPPDALFTVKGGKVASLKDVVGNTVGTTTFTSSNTLWPVLLHRNGIEPDAVKLTKFDPGAIAPMLATARVDATINWVTQATTYTDVLAQVGKQLAIIPWSDFGLDGYGWSLFVSAKFSQDKPQTVAAFVRAMQKAVDFAIEHPETAGPSVHAIAPAVSADKATTEFLTSVPLMKNEVSDKYGIGTFDPGLLKKTWEWVALAQKYQPDRVDPESAVDRSFLRK
jgi:NitT/TauT family transport system substrate-binding protein